MDNGGECDKSGGRERCALTGARGGVNGEIVAGGPLRGEIHGETGSAKKTTGSFRNAEGNEKGPARGRPFSSAVEGSVREVELAQVEEQRLAG
jgi:hypothetical protein